MHRQVQPLPHGKHIGPMVQVHLNAGNGKWFHGVWVSNTSLLAGSFSNMNHIMLGVSLGI
jgi:hypothetical protein